MIVCQPPSRCQEERQRYHVEGLLQTGSWNDKDGVKRHTTEIVASRVQVLTKLQEAPAFAGDQAASSSG